MLISSLLRARLLPSASKLFGVYVDMVLSQALGVTVSGIRVQILQHFQANSTVMQPAHNVVSTRLV